MKYDVRIFDILKTCNELRNYLRDLSKREYVSVADILVACSINGRIKCLVQNLQADITLSSNQTKRFDSVVPLTYSKKSVKLFK